MENENVVATSKLLKLQGFIKIDVGSSKKSGYEFKRKSHFLKLTSIFISSLITVVLGLTLDDTLEFKGFNVTISLKNLAVALSAILTGINTWDAFVSYTFRSQQESSIVNKLTMLYKDIDLYLESNQNCTISDYNSYKDRYNKIHEEYSQDRASSKDEKSEKE
ncbi:hypothetical protein ABIC86_000121 [Paenibacillus sp. DS2363]|uniref:hypothetical protein n=1 Tax=Paenibacillus sp. DS2363 TaxID=3156427 RepID=UPI003396ACFB